MKKVFGRLVSIIAAIPLVLLSLSSRVYADNSGEILNKIILLKSAENIIKEDGKKGYDLLEVLERGEPLQYPSRRGEGKITIKEPKPSCYHPIQKGDTLSKIAIKYNTSVEVLLKIKYNKYITDRRIIHPGKKIQIRRGC
ncbi:MAG TPA: LysM domain-containing protein [Candidatus Pacearchaeota archaeon]|nr:lysM domain protein [archaeon BMS3Abin17]HDK42428.1 LysM domain-containing protein [Candidatus Pacearchaeota archaeon]HDZ60541.1 LysM domain-containing protein [Candidatus Pacearchaeota archaeon]